MPSTTGYSRLSPLQARLVLAALVCGVSICVAISRSPSAQGFADRPREGRNDVDLYQAEVDRIAAGEGYYAAAAAELREFGYPTGSYFNWRTPLPMEWLGRLPSPLVGKLLLCGLSVVLILLGFELTAREGGRLASVIAALLLVGATLPCFLSNFYVMPVLWGGVLIAISVCALGLGRWKLGVGCGIAAVFVRDLAGPYCVLALGLAVVQRRWKEAVGWFAGLCAYAAFFAAHVLAVDGLRGGPDSGVASNWLQAGGAAFLISATQMNGFLLVLPQGISAVFFPLALLGLASWSGPAGRRAGLAALLYVILFAFIGQEINQYWGSLLAPLLALGAARSPLALRDLWQASRGRESLDSRSAPRRMEPACRPS